MCVLLDFIIVIWWPMVNAEGNTGRWKSLIYALRNEMVLLLKHTLSSGLYMFRKVKKMCIIFSLATPCAKKTNQQWTRSCCVAIINLCDRS